MEEHSRRIDDWVWSRVPSTWRASVWGCLEGVYKSRQTRTSLHPDTRFCIGKPWPVPHSGIQRLTSCPQAWDWRGEEAFTEGKNPISVVEDYTETKILSAGGRQPPQTSEVFSSYSCRRFHLDSHDLSC